MLIRLIYMHQFCTRICLPISLNAVGVAQGENSPIKKVALSQIFINQDNFHLLNHFLCQIEPNRPN